jgi:ectoine hydroxylase-related dioxygenase (phytanoyl-CoA dioxygenase family)
MNNLKKIYDEKGYLIVKNAFGKKKLESAYAEILVSKDVDIYYDKNDQIRRIERIYNKGIELNFLNDEIKKILKRIFKEDFVIFKDKFNAKPPGGEGFFCHYDGIFEFTDEKNLKQPGWYKYSDFFINVLIAIDPCNERNGTLELSERHKMSFAKLLQNTKQDGSPDLKQDVESILKFESIVLDIGDVVIFDNTCPHRSKKNNSSQNRRTLYYTYTLKRKGSNYYEYYKDKHASKNTNSKSLSGEI